MFKNLKRDYVIYAICCNETNLKYIGSTSNLTSRLAVHQSTFKCQSSMCRSSLVLESGNYNCIVLEEGIQKQDVKERESFYLSVFKHQIVNKIVRFWLIQKLITTITILSGKLTLGNNAKLYIILALFKLFKGDYDVFSYNYHRIGSHYYNSTSFNFLNFFDLFLV